MTKLFRALPDLVWSFFPIFFLVLVLSLFGKADQIAYRADLVLGASVLFAEGWWKVRSVQRGNAKGFLELLGFLGAMVAVFLSAVMLVSEIGSIEELSKIAVTQRFSSLQLAIEVGSVLYALAVRVILLGEEQFLKELDRYERERLTFLQERFPHVAREFERNRLSASGPNISDEEIEKYLNNHYPDRTNHTEFRPR